MARCISAADASATCPITSSVAGLTLSNVWPESDADELPVDQHPRFVLDLGHGPSLLAGVLRLGPGVLATGPAFLTLV